MAAFAFAIYLLGLPTYLPSQDRFQIIIAGSFVEGGPARKKVKISALWGLVERDS